MAANGSSPPAEHEEPKNKAPSHTLVATTDPEASPTQAVDATSNIPHTEQHLRLTGAPVLTALQFPYAAPTQTPVPPSLPAQTDAPMYNIVSPPAGSETPAALPATAVATVLSTPPKFKKQKLTNSSPVKNCARCIKHRRKCEEGCIFAPYFQADKSVEFDQVVEVFGVKCIENLLMRASTHADRLQVRRSLVYAAEVWRNDPARGTYGVVEGLHQQVTTLQQQVSALEQQLAASQQLQASAQAGQQPLLEHASPAAAADDAEKR